MLVLRGVSDECSDPVNTISSGRPSQSYKSSITLSPHFLSHHFLSWFHNLDRNTQHAGGRNQLSRLTYCRSALSVCFCLTVLQQAHQLFIYVDINYGKSLFHQSSFWVWSRYSFRASLDIRTGVCMCVCVRALTWKCVCVPAGKCQPCLAEKNESFGEPSVCLSEANVFLPV